LLYRYAELIDAGDFDGVGALLSRASFGGTGPQGVSGAENIAKVFAATTRRYPDHDKKTRTQATPRERKVEMQMLGNVSDHLMVDPTPF
jgi:hypothetical protein